MQAANYVNGANNMDLAPDAQIVPGVAGNAVYFPAGSGSLQIDGGDRAEFSVSLWREWDGVVESDAVRGVWSIKNISAHFDNLTDSLSITLPGASPVTTDIKDNQEITHWAFIFAKNNYFRVYKNAEQVLELTAADLPADLNDPFVLGGGKTHAAFDELRIFNTALNPPEVQGLYHFVNKGVEPPQAALIAGKVAPRYLGQVDTPAPYRTVIIIKGQTLGTVDANPGDWVLMGQSTGGWQVGICYRWTGLQWVPLVPESNYTEEYQAALLHIFQIPELVEQTGHYGALFAQILVAQKALIDNLIVKQLKVDSDQSATDDFEVEINETVGILAKNGGSKIFEIKPNGQPYFAGHVATATSQLLEGGVFVQGGGQISVENNGWKGVIRPCDNGVELCILGGDGGAMTKKQLKTIIKNGVLSLFVAGNISCGNIFQNNTAFNNVSHPSSGVNQHLNSVATDGNKWMAVGGGLPGGSGSAFISSNGEIWSSVSGIDVTCAGVATDGNQWVAVGSNGAIFTSPDGQTWTRLYTGTPWAFGDVTTDGNKWVAVGGNGIIFTSQDAQTWTAQSSGTTKNFTSVSTDGSIWIASDNSSTTFTSLDGETWAAQTLASGQYVSGAATDGSMWVAVGYNGTILTSPDGQTWTAQSSGVTSYLKRVATDGIMWVAVGNNGVILTSPDGQTWTAQSSGTTKHLDSVATDGNKWIAVGVNGAILISTNNAVVWQ